MGKPAVPPGVPGREHSPLPLDARNMADWSDDALLAAFQATGDQAAFAEIASRHGAMVFRACLRRVGNVHDAEDAAQAVFLQLARVPGRARGGLGGWLHKVAGDTALMLVRARARRARHEEEAAMRKPTPPPPNEQLLREELDQSIARLPTRLREAVVLCYLEGHKQEEAARILGCNQGTLSRWAKDGLEQLRGRLARRGVAITSIALIGFFAQQKAAAAVPAGLLANLGMAGMGKAAAGVLSAQAAVLADATGKAAFAAKLKLAAAVMLAATAVAAPVVVPMIGRAPAAGRWESAAVLTGHQAGVFAVAFSPDGRLLASTGGDGTIRLWDRDSRQTQTVLPEGGRQIESLAWAPDGQRLACGRSDGVLTFWDLAENKKYAQVQAHRPREGVAFLAFAPNGKTLASAGWDKTAKLWNAATGEACGQLIGHRSGVTAIRFSPDGTRIGTTSNDRSVRLWDVATGKLAVSLTGHRDVVNALDFSPDGRFLATGSRDQTVRLWDLSALGTSTVLDQPGEVHRVAYAPDGKTLAIGCGRRVRLWNVTLAAECGDLTGHLSTVVGLAFSPDGRTLASASYDRDVRLWVFSER